MFSTIQPTTTICAQAAQAEAVALDRTNASDIELAELRLLARAGDVPERDAQLLLAAGEERAARRRARLLTLGRAGFATTLELEAWHADGRDAETIAVRADLQACDLL